MTSKALRDVRISAVQNGFIVVPRDPMYRDGYDQDCYVFQTPEQMAAWLLEQVWSMPVAVIAGEKNG